MNRTLVSTFILFAVFSAIFSSTTPPTGAQAPAKGQPKPSLDKRYEIEVSARLYPQETPQKALQSIVRAIDNKTISYMTAHLADPNFVDPRVADYAKAYSKGTDEAKKLLGFDRLAREVADHMQNDPLLVRELRAFAADAIWDEQESSAVGTVKGNAARKVYMRKMGDRWFLENRQQ